MGAVFRALGAGRSSAEARRVNVGLLHGTLNRSFAWRRRGQGRVRRAVEHGRAQVAWNTRLRVGRWGGVGVESRSTEVSTRGIHRRLGLIGAALAVAVVASTMRLAVASVGTGGGELPQRVVFVVVNDFWVLVTFTLLVAAAVHSAPSCETGRSRRDTVSRAIRTVS